MIAGRKALQSPGKAMTRNIFLLIVVATDNLLRLACTPCPDSLIIIQWACSFTFALISSKMTLCHLSHTASPFSSPVHCDLAYVSRCVTDGEHEQFCLHCRRWRLHLTSATCCCRWASQLKSVLLRENAFCRMSVMFDCFFMTSTDVNLLSFSSGAHFRHREEDVGGFRHKGLHRQPRPRRLPRHGAGEHRCLRRSCAPAL